MYSSYSFMTSALDRVSVQGHTPAAPGERTSSTHSTGSWVCPRASLDTEVRGKIWGGLNLDLAATTAPLTPHVRPHFLILITLLIIFCKEGFTKSKSATTHLITCLDTVTPILRYQVQCGLIYFGLSIASDLVLYPVILDKLRTYGLPTGHVKRYQVTYLIRPGSDMLIFPWGSVLRLLMFNMFNT
jgi:hypothetical protein